jgi:hypothetical protein
MVLIVAVLAVGWSWWQSKRESAEMRQMDEEFTRQAAEAAAQTAGIPATGIGTDHTTGITGPQHTGVTGAPEP